MDSPKLRGEPMAAVGCRSGRDCSATRRGHGCGRRAAGTAASMAPQPPAVPRWPEGRATNRLEPPARRGGGERGAAGRAARKGGEKRERERGEGNEGRPP
eukprot:5056613-Heterocapsa_arctica.AAC.1